MLRHPVDISTATHYCTGVLNFFRSKLLIVFVSLFVLTGYARAVVSSCCSDEKQEHAGHGQTDPSNDDCCQCLCHKDFSNVSAKPVRLPVLLLVLPAVLLPADEFPPDTEPQGIDHPPQLA